MVWKEWAPAGPHFVEGGELAQGGYTGRGGTLSLVPRHSNQPHSPFSRLSWEGKIGEAARRTGRAVPSATGLRKEAS